MNILSCDGTEQTMTNPSNDLVEQVSALTKSVHAMDTSRRVGWAKMYSAIEKLEETEHDWVVAVEDRFLFRQRLSFLYGFFISYLSWLGTPGDTAKAALRESLMPDGARDALLDSVEVNNGQACAERVVGGYPQDDAHAMFNRNVAKEDRLRRREERRAKIDPAMFGDDLIRGVRRSVIDALISQYGLTDEGDLRRTLRLARNDRKPKPDKPSYSEEQLNRAVNLLKRGLKRRETYSLHDVMRIALGELGLSLATNSTTARKREEL